MRTFISRTSRRSFLKSASGVLFLPFLESLSFGAKAATASPKRLVIVHTLHGIPGEAYYTHWVQPNAGRLTALPTILQPLEPYRDNLLVVSGTNMNSIADLSPEFRNLSGVGHQFANECCLTGNHQGASIDYLISEALGNITPHKRILIEVQGGWNLDISYDNRHTPLAYFNSTQAAYSQLFGSNFTPDLSSRETLRAQFTRLFDQVSSDLNQVRRVVSAEDVNRVDSHVNALQDFRLQIDREINNSSVCTAPTVPARGYAGGDSGTQFSLNEALGVIGHAFNCDLARVATLQIHGVQSGVDYSWLLPGNIQGHHSISHHEGKADNINKLVSIRQWHALQIRRFLDLISGMTDSTGESVIDNTIVLWASEVSEPNTHTVINMPYLVVAGRNTGIVQGGNHRIFSGRTTNDLFAAIAKAMQAPIQPTRSGDARFYVGQDKFNEGPLDLFA